MFAAAVRSGELRGEQLFDENYRQIAGANPPQYLTDFTSFTDRALPEIQEALLNSDRRISFCAAVDRNGYLPTHNRKFSQPPSEDPVWNAQNCRNRRIFNDRTGLASARNQKPVLMQTYRRDMGGGSFVVMHEIAAPITVSGRHWGAFRIGFRGQP
jgi:methyl-accepting chemotaxis protein